MAGIHIPDPSSFPCTKRNSLKLYSKEVLLIFALLSSVTFPLMHCSGQLAREPEVTGSVVDKYSDETTYIPSVEAQKVACNSLSTKLTLNAWKHDEINDKGFKDIATYIKGSSNGSQDRDITSLKLRQNHLAVRTIKNLINSYVDAKSTVLQLGVSYENIVSPQIFRLSIVEPNFVRCKEFAKSVLGVCMTEHSMRLYCPKESEHSSNHNLFNGYYARIKQIVKDIEEPYLKLAIVNDDYPVSSLLMLQEILNLSTYVVVNSRITLQGMRIITKFYTIDAKATKTDRGEYQQQETVLLLHRSSEVGIKVAWWNFTSNLWKSHSDEKILRFIHDVHSKLSKVGHMDSGYLKEAEATFSDLRTSLRSSGSKKQREVIIFALQELTKALEQKNPEDHRSGLRKLSTKARIIVKSLLRKSYFLPFFEFLEERLDSLSVDIAQKESISARIRAAALEAGDNLSTDLQKMSFADAIEFLEDCTKPIDLERLLKYLDVISAVIQLLKVKLTVVEAKQLYTEACE